MPHKVHGWFSLLLMAVLLGISVTSLLTRPSIAVAGYLLVTLVGGMLVVYSFCAKRVWEYLLSCEEKL